MLKPAHIAAEIEAAHLAYCSRTERDIFVAPPSPAAILGAMNDDAKKKGRRQRRRAADDAARVTINFVDVPWDDAREAAWRRIWSWGEEAASSPPPEPDQGCTPNGIG